MNLGLHVRALLVGQGLSASWAPVQLLSQECCLVWWRRVQQAARKDI